MRCLVLVASLTLTAAAADQKAAIALYGQAVLTAFGEVENALTNDRALEQKLLAVSSPPLGGVGRQDLRKS